MARCREDLDHLCLRPVPAVPESNERIKIVSANEGKAVENAVFIKRLIQEVLQLQFLVACTGQRDSTQAFDTSLTDVDRYQLKTADLIVTAVDDDGAPAKSAWAADPRLSYGDEIPNLEFTGERNYECI
ncbi:hypothetical protein [Stenotrophomonas sepilia]|uniref:hypothetical protein n=1 Tax=Stenotrophomonas sepilia TaxID=2860290 RepID=UPI0028A054E6|nr:hypothetical protein [Stenotrophomonas maltophilia]